MARKELGISIFASKCSLHGLQGQVVWVTVWYEPTERVGKYIDGYNYLSVCVTIANYLPYQISGESTQKRMRAGEAVISQ